MNNRPSMSRLVTVRDAHHAHHFRDLLGAGSGRLHGRFGTPLVLVSGWPSASFADRDRSRARAADGHETLIGRDGSRWAAFDLDQHGLQRRE